MPSATVEGTRRVRIGLAVLATAIAAAAAAQDAPTAYQRAIAAGYKAAMLCSGTFDAGRTRAEIERDELTGIYPEYDSIVPTLRDVGIDRAKASVSVGFDPALPPRLSLWNERTGCTTQPIGAPPPADRPTYRIPPGPAPRDPRPWPIGDAGNWAAPSPAIAGTVTQAFDAETYGAGSKTVGVVILKDGRIVAERYADGFGPYVPNRTWSVAKSITGTLIGIAAKDGAIDVRAPARIPEWADEDPADLRRRITLDDLMRMASGLHSDTAGNRTDAIYFGGAAVTERATGWPIEARPGTRFRYANNDILLAVRSLRTALGDERYATFPRTALFGPLGMTHTTAETDWRGNYILSSQVWSTARDLARLGQFWLQDGVWQGRRILPAGWMRYLTGPNGPQPDRGEGYGATMWLFGPAQGLPAGSYAAQGNRGQYVMVIPSERLVIVRRGEDPGKARFAIARFAADIARATAGRR